MKLRKEILVCSFWAWLLLPVTTDLIHAECMDFGCSITGTSAGIGLYIGQGGSGSAIMGITSSADDAGHGLYAQAKAGRGVYGVSYQNYGVYGTSDTFDGVYGVTYGTATGGVVGESKGSGGFGVGGYSETGLGVWGVTRSESYAGVQGKNLVKGVGVSGFAAVGTGVVGEGGLNGVSGLSHSIDHAGGYFSNDAKGLGIYAETNSPESANRPAIKGLNRGSGDGLQALSQKGTGIAGTGYMEGVVGVATAKNIDTAGVHGIAYNSYTGSGVKGSANTGYGILGTTKTGTGVYGKATDKGWAGKFYGYKGASGVLINTDGGPGLVVKGGSKSAVVSTSQGARLLYAEEATEVYFTDYGSGKLQDGKAVIPVDPLFAETVNLAQPYHVFVQSYSDAQLVVSRRSARDFEVRLHARDTEGDRNAEFSYRVVARRKGFEQARLERSPYAENTEKRMDADASDHYEKQAALRISESAEVPEPVLPPGQPSPLRPNPATRPSMGEDQ